MLCQPDSDGMVFLVPSPKQGYHHVFLDGSCKQDRHPVLNVAAWGIVNATLGLAIAAGHLHGVSQSIDRAELTALLACLRWTTGTELGLCIWSDSHSTIQIAEYILRYQLIPDGVANLDLWTEVHMLLKDRQGITTDLRWVPSHIPSTAGEDPFEDWIIHWNDAADRLACFTNRTRSSAFWACYRAASSTLDGWAKRVRQLRKFYFKVADYTKPETTPDADHVSIASSHDDPEWLWLSWEDHLPINWRVKCQHGDFKVPGAFIISLIEWICACERLEGAVRSVSDLEFVFALLLDTGFKFPFAIDGTQGLQLRTPESLFQRPTVGVMLRSVQFAVQSIHAMFSDFVIRTEPRQATELGVHIKMPGLRIHLPDQVWQQARSHVQRFTSTREVRRSQDIARPM